MSARQMTLEDFSGSVGEPYEVELNGATHELRLIEATPLPDSGREGGAFRLEFLGPCDPILEQAIRRFRRGAEEHEIFIVPIARDTQGTRYEAIFY